VGGGRLKTQKFFFVENQKILFSLQSLQPRGRPRILKITRVGSGKIFWLKEKRKWPPFLKVLYSFWKEASPQSMHPQQLTCCTPGDAPQRNQKAVYEEQKRVGLHIHLKRTDGPEHEIAITFVSHPPYS